MTIQGIGGTRCHGVHINWLTLHIDRIGAHAIVQYVSGSVLASHGTSPIQHLPALSEYEGEMIEPDLEVLTGVSSLSPGEANVHLLCPLR